MSEVPNDTDSTVLPDNPDIHLTATNAHAKLVHIMARAVESNHPVTRPVCQRNGFYGVEYRKVAAVEEKLNAWFEALSSSPTLSLNPDGEPKLLRLVLLPPFYNRVWRRRCEGVLRTW